MPPRILMIAGEASGDMHGAGVVRELKRRDGGIEVYGIGGDTMRAAGMEIIYHIAGLSFMGFLEVVRNLRSVRRVEKTMEAILQSRRPDVVVLIDYPGFNLRFARRAKAHGIPVLYYISPQVWAWHRSRVKRMKGVVDRMKVVFPFEVDLYRQEGIDVEFVGHPLAERIGSSVSRAEFCRAHGFREDGRIVGLFPGSREQEIRNIFPVMIRTAANLVRDPGVQVGVGVAANLGPAILRKYLRADAPVTLVEHATYDLMCHADAAIVTSGTATLETGWFGTPMAVVYRTSAATFFIGKLLVKVPWIGLVNIVAGKKVVPEFVQHDLTADRLGEAMRRILGDHDFAQNMKAELSTIKEKLGGPGASSRVADGILQLARAA